LWRATWARLLAWRGEHTAARQLIAEAEALISPTWYERSKADLQVAKAEVYQLAGLTDQPAAILDTAVQLYQDRHAPALAEQATAALPALPSPLRQA
jgi:hypothetical protein